MYPHQQQFECVRCALCIFKHPHQRNDQMNKISKKKENLTGMLKQVIRNVQRTTVIIQLARALFGVKDTSEAVDSKRLKWVPLRSGRLN